MSRISEDLFRLPELKEISKQEKRVVTLPNIDLLKGEQRQVFDSCMNDFIGKQVTMASLKGFAGTGKTFLVSMIVEYLLATIKQDYKIAMTAPTNKAVKVLNNTGQFHNPNLEYKTIHSLLGLKEVITPFGEQKFVQEKTEDATVGEYNLVIVDEASMLADELFNYLVPYTMSSGVQLIFVGDPAQIPPIGQDESLPFNSKCVKDNLILEWQLDTIQRQAEGNPIIATTMRIRNALNRPNVLPTRETEYDPETMDGVYFLNGSDRDIYYKLIETYFNSANFKSDADFMKIIAWTNKTVGIFNTIARGMIYGNGTDKVPKLCIGEKLIANKPIQADVAGLQVTRFQNNDDFEVLEFEVKRAGKIGDFYFDYYEVKVEGMTVNGLKRETIRIVHEDSENDYNQVIKTLAEVAKAQRRGSYEAASKWKEFYRFKEIFADVSYNYAITGHKSQGSTYDNVLIIEDDIDKNRKVTERNRIKYTTFSRPVNKLIVLKS